MQSQTLQNRFDLKLRRGLWATVCNFAADFGRRRRFRKLLTLDDRMLSDIGLTREEVLWGAGLPLSDNASLLVHHKARVRRRGEGWITLKLP